MSILNKVEVLQLSCIVERDSTCYNCVVFCSWHVVNRYLAQVAKYCIFVYNTEYAHIHNII